MVAASVARAKSDNTRLKSEQDLSSDFAVRDLNISAAEHTASILNMREVSESRSSVNFVTTDDMLTSPSSRHSNENNDLEDYNTGSSAKAFHPDDFRRRLVPFADIFNRPLPVFPSHPITSDETSKAEEGYCCVSDGSTKSVKGGGDFIDEELAGLHTYHSNELAKKLYPVLEWKLKAGVMYVYHAKSDSGAVGSSSTVQSNDVRHHDNINVNGNRERSDQDSQFVNLFPVLSFEEFVRDFNQVRTYFEYDNHTYISG